MISIASCPHSPLQPDWDSDLWPEGLAFPRGLDQGSVKACFPLEPSLKHRYPSLVIAAQSDSRISQNFLAQNLTPYHNPVTP